MFAQITNLNGNISLGDSTNVDGVLTSYNNTIVSNPIEKNGILSYVNGQITTVISNDATPDYNSNLGREWNVLPNLPCTTDKIQRVGLSRDAQVILIAMWYSNNFQRVHYVSDDCGVTWQTVDGLPTGNTNIFDIVMSIDGKHQYVRSDNDVYRTSNYGKNFTKVTWPPGYDIRSAQLDCDSTGQYVITGTDYSRGYAVSNDHGETWTSFSYTDSGNWSNVCVSYDGTTMFALSTLGYLKKSTDNGLNWSQIYRFGPGGSSGAEIGGIGCSGDGKIVYIGLIYDGITNNFRGSRSLDGGLTWSVLSVMDNNDVYYGKPFVSVGGGYIFYQAGGSNYSGAFSRDGGTTWSYIRENVTEVGGGALTFAFDKSMTTGFNLLYQKSNGLKISRKDDFLLPITQPLVPGRGSVYFNVSNNTLYIYNGTTWRTIATS